MDCYYTKNREVVEDFRDKEGDLTTYCCGGGAYEDSQVAQMIREDLTSYCHLGRVCEDSPVVRMIREDLTTYCRVD